MTIRIVGCAFITAGAIGAVNLPSVGLRLVAVFGLLLGVLLVIVGDEE